MGRSFLEVIYNNTSLIEFQTHLCTVYLEPLCTLSSLPYIYMLHSEPLLLRSRSQCRRCLFRVQLFLLLHWLQVKLL